MWDFGNKQGNQNSLNPKQLSKTKSTDIRNRYLTFLLYKLIQWCLRMKKSPRFFNLLIDLNCGRLICYFKNVNECVQLSLTSFFRQAYGWSRNLVSCCMQGPHDIRIMPYTMCKSHDIRITTYIMWNSHDIRITPYIMWKSHDIRITPYIMWRLHMI